MDLSEVDMLKIGLLPGHALEGPFVPLLEWAVAVVAIELGLVVVSEHLSSAYVAKLERLHWRQLAKVSRHDQLQASKWGRVSLHPVLVEIPTPNSGDAVVHALEVVVLNHADLVDNEHVRVPDALPDVLAEALLDETIEVVLEVVGCPAHVRPSRHAVDLQGGFSSRGDDVDNLTHVFQLPDNSLEDSGFAAAGRAGVEDVTTAQDQVDDILLLLAQRWFSIPLVHGVCRNSLDARVCLRRRLILFVIAYR